MSIWANILDFQRSTLFCPSVCLHLQQAFFFMGWAVRMTVVSLTVSSCSINTLRKDIQRKLSKKLQMNFPKHIFKSVIYFLDRYGLFLAGTCYFALTWPDVSETLSHSCLCRHWPQRTSLCFPAQNVNRKSSQAHWWTGTEMSAIASMCWDENRLWT